MIKKYLYCIVSLLLTHGSLMTAQVMINEYSAANLTTIANEFNKHEDWIELYNAGSTAVDLTGYYLSDNPDQPLQWRFPAKSSIKANNYLVVWCDGRDTLVASGTIVRGIHANFKLTQTKKTAETLIFSDASGKKIDEIKIAKTRQNQSRGRLNDGATQWVIFKAPTPRKKNEGEYFTANAEKPQFSVKAGFYTTAQNITITSKAPDAKIYYSLDGTDPTPQSIPYTTPFTIDKTAVLKAKAYTTDPSIQPSLVEFSTYFINEKPTLKVVSVTGGSELDSLIGGNKDYKPFGSFELFDTDGERKATTYGEFNSHGQDSWVNDQRSIDFVSRDECGYNNAIKDKIFALTDRDEFQRIILRAAGDDNYPDGSDTKGGGAHMRDAYLQNLVKKGKLQLDVRTAEKAIVYMNGNYWGVYDLRERPDDHDYTDYNYGQGKYDLQFIQTWADTWAEYGDQKAINDWNIFTKYIQNHDMTNPDYYKYVTDRLDIKSLSDYIIVNSISTCSDWINYNTGWWRGMNPQGTHRKWGYHLWDNDATFGYYRNFTGIPDTAANKAKPCDVELLKDSVTIIYEPYIADDTIEMFGEIFYPGDTIFEGGSYRTFVDLNKHIFVFTKLLQNPEFKQFYLTRYADLIHTVFSQQNMLAYFDEVYHTIKPEMARHIAKWGGTMQEWEHNVAKMRNYIIRRTNYLSDGIKDCYQLTGPYDVTINTEGALNPILNINSLLIDKFPFTTKCYGNIATKLTADANSTDFAFEKWTGDTNGVLNDALKANTLADIKGNAYITAHFMKAIIDTHQPTQPNQTITKVFPTVFDEKLNVEIALAETSVLTFNLYNIAGQEVFNTAATLQPQAIGNYNISLYLPSSLQRGTYILEIKTPNARFTHKVIKQ